MIANTYFTNVACRRIVERPEKTKRSQIQHALHAFQMYRTDVASRVGAATGVTS